MLIVVKKDLTLPNPKLELVSRVEDRKTGLDVIKSLIQKDGCDGHLEMPFANGMQTAVVDEHNKLTGYVVARFWILDRDWEDMVEKGY